MSKFINYLVEKVINIDNAHIKQRLQKVMSKVPDGNRPSRPIMIYLLNQEFKSDEVYFELLTKNQNF